MLPRILFFLFVVAPLVQADGYRIEVAIDGYEREKLVLGYHFGGMTYEKQIATRNAEGEFLFSAEALPKETDAGDRNLPSGLYYLIVPGTADNAPAILYELFLDSGEDRFRLESSMEHLIRDLKITGDFNNFSAAKYNELFLKNLKAFQVLENKPDKTEQERMDMGTLQKFLDTYRQGFFTSNPNSIVSLFMTYRPYFDYPEFEGSEAEVEMQKYQYARENFFDRLDLSDPRHLRFPGPLDVVETYVEDMVPQRPDRVFQAVQRVITLASENPATFQFYVVYFLNKYAKSNVLGHDSVYVDIIMTYYKTGKADWVDEDRRRALVSMAERLSPVLVGRTAPELNLTGVDGKTFSLGDVDSEWTVLFFWDPESPDGLEEARALEQWRKKKGADQVSVVAIPVGNTGNEAATALESAGLAAWKFGTSPFASNTYLVREEQPYKIFVLNKNKRITFKRIDGSQVGILLESLL